MKMKYVQNLGLNRDKPPRKVIIGTSLLGFWGRYPGLDKRLKELGKLIDEIVGASGKKYSGRKPDIIALPEFAVNGGLKGHASVTAQELQGPVLVSMAAKAGEHGCYLAVPLYMIENRKKGIYFNIVALLDRKGKLTGIYRYAHPSGDEIKNGLTPGKDFPVFNCDFGRVGIQICGDVLWQNGWRSLKRKGAELVILTAQPPWPLATSMQARTNQYYVVTSTWRNSAALFSPTGHVLSEIKSGKSRVMAQEIDLNYVILGWQSALGSGKSFDRKYGKRAGYRYWEEDDCGLFWSNDKKKSILSMLHELGLKTLDEEFMESFVRRRQ